MTAAASGNSELQQRIAERLGATVAPEVANFGAMLGREADACAVLFYGSNLRTGSLDGVLDFYVLLPGAQKERIWPRIGYREWTAGETMLRAKIAVMSLEKFAAACRGETRDTTIWARFVQPSALVWSRDATATESVENALTDAAVTAGELAAALGPDSGTAEVFWQSLFEATYRAEFRVEKQARAGSIVEANRAHFAGLLPLAWAAGGIAFEDCGKGLLRPRLPADRRSRVLRWWNARRRLGKPLNLLRLAKASTTFEGAADYAAWKIERHTGTRLEVTPFRRKYPLLAAPSVLFALWRIKRERR
ncbi:hypothetical protein [Qipengyuania atrilutea]|uniref:Phosphatidate cytidylyltransferase n=1 Tax=Qipengyuania atrilutea TaxID=2744473 RepID=A0A850H3V4_9SPHN|nr:hypothetical protein [Actirhodobacter atriluteus]NVD44553.1 hypothetical protein [Actirhodobacter atriluteus]